MAKLPSYFLIFDRITSLPETVAQQFIGNHHALSFEDCPVFSPATLRALSEAACFLKLGLKNMNIEQARALTYFCGDLMLEAEHLPADVLRELRDAPNLNLCLAPDYGITVISQEEYENLYQARVERIPEA